MKNPIIYLFLAMLMASCSNVTTGFEMIGEFSDGKYINDFSVESRYWPSFVMVIPENTDLEDKKLEAVAIFNDYGVMNEQNPVGYNISHFTQNGISANRKTLYFIEDKENMSLYLDDANAESIAYSTYDDELEIYEYFILAIDGDESKLVASGDGDKLNSYSSVVGKEIFWTEIKGDEVQFLRDHLDGSKEVMISYPNAYAFLLESNGPYISYYVEEFDDEYNLLSNDVIIYDVVNNEEMARYEIDSDYELTSGNYDGENIFYTGYDYGSDEYFYATQNEAGDIEEYDRVYDNDFTFTGTGNSVMAMENMGGARSDFYRADVYNFSTGETSDYSDLLNAGFYNDYLFYVECDVNSSYLINEISLHITKGE